jgi:hypothetical protein
MGEGNQVTGRALAAERKIGDSRISDASKARVFSRSRWQSSSRGSAFEKFARRGSPAPHVQSIV